MGTLHLKIRDIKLMICPTYEKYFYGHDEKKYTSTYETHFSCEKICYFSKYIDMLLFDDHIVVFFFGTRSLWRSRTGRDLLGQFRCVLSTPRCWRYLYMVGLRFQGRGDECSDHGELELQRWSARSCRRQRGPVQRCGFTGQDKGTPQ